MSKIIGRFVIKRLNYIYLEITKYYPCYTQIPPYLTLVGEIH